MHDPTKLQQEQDPSKLQQEIQILKDQISQLHKFRLEERAGRINAEKQRRRLEQDGYEMRPIGYLKTPFDGRNGCPRQPHLISSSRGQLLLLPHIPKTSLSGLEEYSHCWVLYVFHQNTDLGRDKGIKGKVSVPRLNGEKVGWMATRSPHRANPIGLSTARIISVDVDAGVLVLGGIDIVDASPILDIKPFLPFSDALKWEQVRQTVGVEPSLGPGEVFAPSFVSVQTVDDPVFISAVHPLSPANLAKMTECWSRKKQEGEMLYDSPQEFCEFVKQCLSRDIRSLHKRLNWSGNTIKSGNSDQDAFHVTLHGITISYLLHTVPEKSVEIVNVSTESTEPIESVLESIEAADERLLSL